MVSLSQVARQALEKALIEFGEDAKFVIFPFGEGGKILKGILNYEYGIWENAIIDNGLADINSAINKISYLKEHQDAVVLVSAYRTDQFNAIRKQLYASISQDRCVEVFEKLIWDDRYYGELLRLSKIYELDREFVRVGNKNDGGYVMVDDMPGGIAYSFGISDDPTWDLDMFKRGYEVYMYDHTVECPHQVEQYKDRLHFFKIGIADRYSCDNLKTLDELIKFNGHENENNMILKMDVEGAEWGFLAMTTSETLSKFSQIVFEFHRMNTMDEKQRIDIIRGLSKLYETHRVVHIHGNNWSGFISSPSHNIPNTWEVTYVRKNGVKKIAENVNLPIGLDCPCNEWKDEIVIGDWNKPLQISWDGTHDWYEKVLSRYYTSCPSAQNDKIYVIGDSHVSFFSSSDLNHFIYKDGIGICRPRIEPFRIFHLGPALAYNLNRYGTTTQAREKIDHILNSNYIPLGGKILCVFGEIDIRVHVFKQACRKNVDFHQVVDEIIDEYVSFIERLSKKYTVFVWCPVASQRDDGYLDSNFPRSGTQVERNKAIEYFIDKLEDKCSKSGIAVCLSIFSSLVDENYKTKMMYYRDSVHISQRAWDFASKVFEQNGISTIKKGDRKNA